MATDTSTQAKGDIRAQQAYFARLFNEGLNHSTSGSPVSITRESAKERLSYLKNLPYELQSDSLQPHGNEDKSVYAARRVVDQRNYNEQNNAVKKGLAWMI